MKILTTVGDWKAVPIGSVNGGPVKRGDRYHTLTRQRRRRKACACHPSSPKTTFDKDDAGRIRALCSSKSAAAHVSQPLQSLHNKAASADNCSSLRDLS